MAKPGSMLCACLNASFASSYSKLCSSATPQRNEDCASADPDVDRKTPPKPQAGAGGDVLSASSSRPVVAAARPDVMSDYAAVAFFDSTSSNTLTAFLISSIVPNEIRQCFFSKGGKSRATSTPLVLHASRNSFAGRPISTNMKLACESVGFMPLSANHFMVNSRTALLRARSAAMFDASC